MKYNNEIKVLFFFPFFAQNSHWPISNTNICFICFFEIESKKAKYMMGEGGHGEIASG